MLDQNFGMEQLTSMHFKWIRTCPSFQAYINSNLCDKAERLALLQKDKSVYTWTQKCFQNLVNYNTRFSVGVNALYRLQLLFPNSTGRRHKNFCTLYKMAIRGEFVNSFKNDHLNDLFGLFKNTLNKDDQKSFIESLRDDCLINEETFIACSEDHTALEELLLLYSNESSQEEEQEEEEEVLQEALQPSLKEDSKKRILDSAEHEKLKKRRRTMTSIRAGTALYLENDSFKISLMKGMSKFFK
jgi:hypothetical protein